MWDLSGAVLQPVLRLGAAGASPGRALLPRAAHGLLVSAHADGSLLLRTLPPAPGGPGGGASSTATCAVLLVRLGDKAPVRKR